MSKKKIKGFKVMNPDMTCLDFKYEIGKTYELDGSLILCNRGFHFCTKASDCFNYYSFNSENVVCEIEAIGNVVEESGSSKCATNKIKILRKIGWHEVLEIVNSGNDCTGLCNSGNWNSGDWNSGNRNSGDCNSGNWNSGNRNSGNWNSGNRNSGNWNSGDCNSGNCNSGNCNSGNRNSGNRNSGNWNSGDWNSGDCTFGAFNTDETKICMFDEPTDLSLRDWWNTRAYDILVREPLNTMWINEKDMSKDEKKNHPEHETQGGYLKDLDNTEIMNNWWKNLDEDDRAEILTMPNFDSEKFCRCTGVDITIFNEYLKV